MADEPRTILHRGWPALVWPDGRIRPVVSGGIDEGGDSGDAGADDGAGESEGGDTDDPPDDIDWKAMSRKHEREAKKAHAELEKVRKANQTEQEKAIDAAKDEGRRAALVEAGERLAAAEIRAALSTVVDDPKSIIEDLNLAKYVTEDGDVDEDAVAALRQKFAAIGGKKRSPSFDGGAKDKDAPGSGSFLSEALRNKRGA